MKVTEKRRRVTFWLDHAEVAAIDAIKEQTGVTKAEQLRRALRAWVASCRRRQRRVEAHLKDGRMIDLSGLSSAEAVARLRQAGVETKDIEQTLHNV